MSKSLLLFIVLFVSGLWISMFFQTEFTWLRYLILVLPLLSALLMRNAFIRIMAFTMPLFAGLVYGLDTTPESPAMHSTQCGITACVLKSRVLKNNTLQLVCRTRSKIDSVSVQPYNQKIVVLVFNVDSEDPEPGQIWLFNKTEMEEIDNHSTSSGFNAGRYWKSQGVSRQLKTRSSDMSLLGESNPLSFISLIYRLRKTLLSIIDRLPLQPVNREVIEALILGEKSGVEKEVRDNFTKAGIAHMLAVSGLHVGIIYAILSLFLKGLRIRTTSWIHFVSMIFVIWIYTGTTGLGPSACRAAGMLTLYELIRLAGIRIQSCQVIGVTVLLHLLLNRWVIFQTGAHLSYGAVLGILWMLPKFKSLEPRNKYLRWPVKTVLVSISVQIIIFPLLVLYFGRFPLMFLFGCLILVPLWLIMFYSSLVFMGISIAGIQSCPLFSLFDQMMTGLLKINAWAAALPGNSWMPGHFGVLEFAGWYFFWIILAQYIVTRRTIYLFIIMSGLLCFAFINLCGEIIFTTKLQ